MYSIYDTTDRLAAKELAADSLARQVFLAASTFAELEGDNETEEVQDNDDNS